MTILDAIQSTVPRTVDHVNVGLAHLPQMLEMYGIDLDPDYQREYVWTPDQKRNFVGAMLEQPRIIPPIWLNWDEDKTGCQVVDGKQRINACLGWLAGDFAAHCPCGTKVYVRELGEVDRRNLGMNVVMDWNFIQLDRTGVLDFYLRLNSGGTVHRESELSRVRAMLKKEREEKRR
jgi:hypothetical protein